MKDLHVFLNVVCVNKDGRLHDHLFKPYTCTNNLKNDKISKNLRCFSSVR